MRPCPKPAGLLLPLLPLLAWLGYTPVAGAAPDADTQWPQWRGPHANGTAPTANPPISWSETSNVRWKVPIPGRGTATPIIWGNQIFLQTAIPAAKAEATAPATPVATPSQSPPAEGPGRRRGGGGPGGRGEQASQLHQFVLLCLDRQSGKVRWQKVAREELPHEGHHPDHGFSSYSSITDGQSVFAYFGSRGLYCYDLEGNLKWEKQLGKMKTRNGFGEGSSPALQDDTLVVVWDHEGDDFIVALDKNTGKEKWRQPRDEPTGWSTPLILPHSGRHHVVVNATGKVRAYDLETGAPLWECAGQTANAIPSPVGRDGVVYVTSGFRGSALQAIKLGHKGDLAGTDAIVWNRDKNTPYVPSPLLYGNHLYLFAGNNNVLSCLDSATGNILIDAQRVEGLQGVYASPVGAAGRVYLTGRNGTVVVLKQADTYEVLATNKLDERIDASPAAVGRELFLRSHSSLYCLAEN